MDDVWAALLRAFPGNFPAHEFDRLSLETAARLYGMAVKQLQAEADAIERARRSQS